MKLKVLVLFLIIVVANLKTNAQEDSVKNDILLLHTISKSNQLAIKVSIDNDFETFKLITPGYNLSLYPNISTTAKIRFSYRFLSLKLGYSAPFFPSYILFHL